MKKKNYETPKMETMKMELVTTIMVSSNPSGTGEDMPWETSEEIYSVWKKNF